MHEHCNIIPETQKEVERYYEREFCLINNVDTVSLMSIFQDFGKGIFPKRSWIQVDKVQLCVQLEGPVTIIKPMVIFANMDLLIH